MMLYNALNYNKNLPKFHNASLRVEGEIGDVNVAGAFVDRGRFPDNPAVAVQYGLVHYSNHVIAVRVIVQNQIGPPNIIGGHVQLCVSNIGEMVIEN